MVTHAECVAECPKDGYFSIGTRCIKEKTEKKISENKNGFDRHDEETLTETITEEEADFQIIFKKSWKAVIISIIVSAVFSFGVLFMFRYAIKQIIWGIYIGLVVIMFLFSIGFVIAYVVAAASDDSKARNGAELMLIPAGIFGIAGVISAIILYLFRNRIKLVVQIFKEASKVLRDIVHLLFEPILTFIALVLSFSLFIYYVLVIANAGKLEEFKDEHENFLIASYVQTEFQYVSHVINIVVFYWFVNFILGCQHFVIASTVCQWYFTRDKTKLENPLKRAFSHLLRFHIGSVCLGSILITIVKIVLGTLRYLTVSWKQNTWKRFDISFNLHFIFSKTRRNRPT